MNRRLEYVDSCKIIDIFWQLQILPHVFFEKILIKYLFPPTKQYCSGVFRILILRVPSVNRIFPLRVLTAGAISLFLNITGAIAPMAPVLNTPLLIAYVSKKCLTV